MKIRLITNFILIMVLLIPLVQSIPVGAAPSAPQAVIYYVSQSLGDDSNDGLSEGAAFETIAKVNTLGLQPGDQVLFKCGDTWRTDPLMIVKSGVSGEPITFGSYPASCLNKPVLSGLPDFSSTAACFRERSPSQAGRSMWGASTWLIWTLERTPVNLPWV